MLTTKKRRTDQLFVLIMFCTILLPLSLQAQSNWYKGNLHTHSLWSDGNDYPEMIMQWYFDHDYQFVCLSEHNVMAMGERWIELNEQDSVSMAIFQRYQATFGEDWVEVHQQAGPTMVRLKTLEEYRSLFAAKPNFLILAAEEITDGFEGKPIHLNATHLQTLIPPQSGNSVVEVMQNNIDAVHEQRAQTGQDMIVHLNHPNFGWAITAEDMKQLEGERFFEVYNGHPAVHNEGDETHLSTEQIWDEVNTAYCLAGKPLMLGLATDDSHHYLRQSSDLANSGRGWVMVQAEELSPEALIRSLEAGDFYASSGVSLKKISYQKDRIKVKVDPEKGVNYTIEFMGTLREDLQKTGVVLQRSAGKNGLYKFQGTELFVRARIVSDKRKENPYQKGEVEKAWLQPVRVWAKD
jgi:hypothetical protein